MPMMVVYEIYEKVDDDSTFYPTRAEALARVAEISRYTDGTFFRIKVAKPTSRRAICQTLNKRGFDWLRYDILEEWYFERRKR